jgi:hypothetical protein
MHNVWAVSLVYRRAHNPQKFCAWLILICNCSVSWPFTVSMILRTWPNQPPHVWRDLVRLGKVSNWMLHCSHNAVARSALRKPVSPSTTRSRLSSNTSRAAPAHPHWRWSRHNQGWRHLQWCAAWADSRCCVMAYSLRNKERKSAHHIASDENVD